MESRSEGQVLVDFGQFYAYDAKARWGADELNFDRADLRAGIWAGSTSVAIYTPRQHGPVTVRVETHLDPPDPDLNRWDHVVEASILAASGRLVVDSWETSLGQSIPVTVGRGPHRVRVHGRGFDRVYAAESTGDEALGEDEYLIQIWVADPEPTRVLKQWAGFLTY